MVGTASKKVAVLIIILALAGLLLVACGSGSSSSPRTSADTGGGEASSQFLVAGKPNKIARFGQEATAAEREAASSVLEQNLRARAAGDWAKQCSSLTAAIVAGIKERASNLGIEHGCAKDLETEAEPAPKSVRVDTLTGPIDALRVKGDRGYALYHGKHGIDYAMPMRKEDDTWKVAAEVTTKLP